MSLESRDASQLLQRLSVPEIVDRLAAHPAGMARLAKLLLDGGDVKRAVELADQARRLSPDDPEIERIARQVLGGSVPDWHHMTLADEARNAAYDAALRRNVRSHSRVLDIGAGSGLLAMMAARAGAAEVVSCEVNPAMAAAAATIVAHNGYADRVRIVGKNSADLRLGTDLAAPADILVSRSSARTCSARTCSTAWKTPSDG